MKDDFSYEILPPAHWVAQPSINFKSQLNLKCNINFMYIPSKFKCQLNLKCNINFMYIPSKFKCQLSFN